MASSIAFFDFDGTITRSDTMFAFCKHTVGIVPYTLGMVRTSPWLAGFKMGILTATQAKEKLLQTFFHGVKLETFNKYCNDFFNEVIPHLLREDAMQEISYHKKNKNKVVVVSASAENWIRDFCDAEGIDLIATRLEVDTEERITGKLLGINCNYEEKVNRIKAAYNLSSYDKIYAYGDSDGDRAMLQIATDSFYQRFTK
ncbi:MAG: HAD-IB family hydrolase [Ferruginibacter sp.]|nr:HAD-IB family hydrolase [Ferruginibacter sp.]